MPLWGSREILGRPRCLLLLGSLVMLQLLLKLLLMLRSLLRTPLLLMLLFLLLLS